MMRIFQILFGNRNKPKSLSEIPSKTRKRIFKESIKESNQMQLDILKKYDLVFNKGR